MARIRNRRAARTSNSGASWISYSDMMAALLLVFVLILSVSLYQYFTMLETKTAELDAQKALVSQQQVTLDAQTLQLASQQVTMDKQATEIAIIQVQLDSQAKELENAYIVLSDQQAQLQQAQTDLADREAKLIILQTDLKNKEMALQAANEVLENQQAAMAAQAEQIDALIGIRPRIITALSSALSSANLSATVDHSTGDIVLDSSVLFDTGKSEIRAEGKALLDRFVPVYLNVLLRDELLTADGGRVRTNFIITSGAQEEARLAVYDAHKDELSREIVRQLMAHEQEIRAIGFIGCDVPMPRLLWWLIYRCTAALPNPAEMPPRPYHADGGAYHLMGFAREPENRHYLAWDYNGPMYNDGFRWFGLQHFGNSPVQDLFEPNQPHMGKLCALLIRLIQADFDPSCVTADEQELLAELLARGFLRKADGSIKPNFCVLTREQVQRLRQEVFLPIVEAVQPAWTRVCNELRTLCKASVPKHLQALADLPLHMAALAAGYMTEQIAYAYGALEKPETPEDAAMWTLVYEPEIKVTPHK